jgi:two-component system response regulator
MQEPVTYDQVLLAEDDEDHVLLLHRALRTYPRKVKVLVARDGQEALDLLFAGGVRPQLILLDINMPKLTGLEVLRGLKQDPTLRRIPTVMLTTSAREEDREASLRGGADDFLTKPVNFRTFTRSLFDVLDQYLRTAAPAD